MKQRLGKTTANGTVTLVLPIDYATKTGEKITIDYRTNRRTRPVRARSNRLHRARRAPQCAAPLRPMTGAVA
jgi:hypothetical protein